MTFPAHSQGFPDRISEALPSRNLSYPAYVAMANSEDTIEDPKAFAEMRTPNWRGR
jgi:hypothetical protein